jgi:hypothetical protein
MVKPLLPVVEGMHECQNSLNLNISLALMQGVPLQPHAASPAPR